jgi:competence protein ComEC
MDPGISHTSLTYIRMINAIEKYNIKYYQSTARKIQLGLMNFSVLPSANPKIYVSEFNNNSVVFKLEYKNFSCLYTGDIERGRENQLVKISSSNLESDIIKIPHHGSSTSSNSAFIKKVNPKVAIISCGQNNRYGHPNIKTLGRLEKNGIDIYRTDTDGTILINTDGYNYEVIVEKSPNLKISKKVININLATLEDFVQLLGIDEVIANNLLLYRTLNNGFKYPEEIKMVLGIGIWEWEEWKKEGWVIVVK